MPARRGAMAERSTAASSSSARRACSAEPVTQTLEPRLFYVYVPYRNQDHIPLFDTALADFNYAQLFTENRFVGGDRFGDANQLTAALTSRFLQADGQEGLRATLGQRYYFRDERVAPRPGVARCAPPASPTSSPRSAAASRGHWTFDVTTQYNPHEPRRERYGVAVRYSPELAKVLNASYRYQRERAAPDRHLRPVADPRRLVWRGTLQLLPSRRPAARRPGRLRIQRRLLGVPLRSCSACRRRPA